ncbi:MAG: alpha/beta hydrolase [Rhodospirillum sp.]|nr:alpha/beta hydrolase [Rhodospirillum sp.]
MVAMRCAHATIAAAILLALVGHSEAADPPFALATEEFMVDAGDPGVQLYVRNKHPVDLTQVPSGHVLLYVHGATQPSEATFDLQLEGLSWMDYIASRGWDVYLMDARGYGGSTRSPELLQSDAIEAPIVSTDIKVRDAEAVIGFILKRRGEPRISLLGWSWGTIVVGAYAATHTDKVGSLVLHAPVWCQGSCEFDPHLAEARSDSSETRRELGLVVESSMEGARNRMQAGVPYDRRDELLPLESFAAWSAAALATDPVGATQTPPVLRVPPGVNQDSQASWDQGKSYYDPGKITAPTLVVVAEWDDSTPPDGAKALHDSLASSAHRRFVELKEGSHMMLLEKNRMSLFEAVQQFLDTASAPH